MLKYENNIGNVAIIPARIGSKRIKKKNVKKFYGKPILELTYEIVKKSKIFDKIILSSDSNEILKLGKNIGFDILIKRPKKLSGDYIGTAPVIKHAINFLSHNFKIKNVCCVYPCNPLIFISDLKKAYSFLKRKNNNFIFPITSYSHPIERSFFYNNLNNKIFFNNKNYFSTTRTQDIKKRFHDAGQFYFSSSKTWLDMNKAVFRGIDIPNWRAIDIDNIEDWKRAEIIFRYLKEKSIR
jgi:pseudaminic acid cytidylyltransferase